MFIGGHWVALFLSLFFGLSLVVISYTWVGVSSVWSLSQTLLDVASLQNSRTVPLCSFQGPTQFQQMCKDSYGQVHTLQADQQGQELSAHQGGPAAALSAVAPAAVETVYVTVVPLQAQLALLSQHQAPSSADETTLQTTQTTVQTTLQTTWQTTQTTTLQTTQTTLQTTMQTTLMTTLQTVVVPFPWPLQTSSVESSSTPPSSSGEASDSHSTAATAITTTDAPASSSSASASSSTITSVPPGGLALGGAAVPVFVGPDGSNPSTAVSLQSVSVTATIF